MSGTYQSESINELAAALAAAQAEIENPTKDRENPHFRSKYADLASILNVCRKPLAKNGLAVIQTAAGDYERPMLRTMLVHKSGQWIAGEVPLIGDLTKAQALGSLITYMRRYTLAAIVGVAQEDDDGNEASSGGYQNGYGNRSSAGSYQPSSPAPSRPSSSPPSRPSSPPPSPRGNQDNPADYPAPDMSRVPTSGKGMYAWSKQAQTDTGFDWTGQMIAIGKQMGFPAKTYDWSQDQVKAVWNRIQSFLDESAGKPQEAGVAPPMQGEDGEDITF